MAPRSSAPARRKTINSEQVFSLGVQGRKTGVVLPDDGVRDEHGIQPLDGIFDSSPARGGSGDVGDTSEVDMSMDLENTPGPDPRSLLKSQQSLRRPIPRAVSPHGTNLQSPPRRPSSPLRPSTVAPNGSVMPKSAARKLDFNNLPTHAFPRPTSSHAAKVLGNGRSGSSDDGQEEGVEEEETVQEESALDAIVDESVQMLDVGGDESDLVPALENGDVSQHSNESTPLTAAAARKKAAVKPAGPQKRGRKRRSNGTDAVVATNAESEERTRAAEESEQPAQATARRGRPPKGKGKNKGVAVKPAPNSPKSRRSLRNSLGSSSGDKIAEEPEQVSEPEPEPEQEPEPESEPEPEPEPEPAPKRQRLAGPPAAKPARGRGRKPAAVAPIVEEAEGESSAAKPKGRRGRPAAAKPRAEPAAGDDPDASVLVAPRPPMPKRRGLVINRREVPADPSAIFHTRSGRNSIKPLAWWKNERVEQDYEAGTMEDVTSRTKSRILLPSMKSVHRVAEASPPPRPHRSSRRGAPSKSRSKRGRGGASDSEDDGDDEAEPWEAESGEVMGPVVVWEDRHVFDPPGVDDEVDVTEGMLALAGRAIKTKDALGSTFRFTKVLTTPFYGVGVVDLPPGAEKKAKNSRKMMMTFIVHTGRPTVMVNNTTFTIGKGGVFFVPRGNYYSLVNETKKPSRIFFSQACEIYRDLEAETDAAVEKVEGQGEDVAPDSTVLTEG